ncbi:acylphosphatase [Stakelama tenebrarum]|uniref:acylphosphatase n=1 Tax=Stakelama tenebrarum TaxID=2711215 RepID=A0A6G6Y5L9_9SPHN|nr:acylphosphatase [Sphingosinithalassobacter tenebrarum]QIG80018.1 acylphosphatase [Sphingosinithalassobacter tenebrarum]
MGSRRLLIEGRVQRVGYRDWAVRTAREWNITGWVRNMADGRVEIVAVGDDSAIDAFTDDCRTGPVMADVARVEATAMEAPKVKGFTKRLTA